MQLRAIPELCCRTDPVRTIKPLYGYPWTLHTASSLSAVVVLGALATTNTITTRESATSSSMLYNTSSHCKVYGECFRLVEPRFRLIPSLWQTGQRKQAFDLFQHLSCKALSLKHLWVDGGGIQMLKINKRHG